MSGILDRLPAAVEHMVVLFGAVFGTACAAAVVSSGHVSVLWDSTAVLTSAVDAAAVTVAGSLVLTFTALTRRYGVGSGTSDPDPGNVGADPGNLA